MMRGSGASQDTCYGFRVRVRKGGERAYSAASDLDLSWYELCHLDAR